MRKFYIKSYIDCLLFYIIFVLNNKKEGIYIIKIIDEYLKKMSFINNF